MINCFGHEQFGNGGPGPPGFRVSEVLIYLDAGWHNSSWESASSTATSSGSTKDARFRFFSDRLLVPDRPDAGTSDASAGCRLAVAVITVLLVVSTAAGAASPEREPPPRVSSALPWARCQAPPRFRCPRSRACPHDRCAALPRSGAPFLAAAFSFFLTSWVARACSVSSLKWVLFFRR